MRRFGIDRVRRRLGQFAHQGAAAVAALHCALGMPGPSYAADEQPDCIAIAKSPGASLLIDGQSVAVKPRGMLVPQCSRARFASPVVRLHFLRSSLTSVVSTYDSKKNDEGAAVAERVTIGGSIKKLIGDQQSKPREQVPAGQYASSGLFSLRKTSYGEYITILDPSEQYGSDDKNVHKLTFSLESEPRQVTVAEGLPCGVLDGGLINCSKNSKDPKLSAFPTKRKPSGLEEGMTYVLQAPNKPDVRLTFLEQDSWGYIFDRKPALPEPPEPSELLKRLLLRVSVADLVGDAKAAADARTDLRAKFSDLR